MSKYAQINIKLISNYSQITFSQQVETRETPEEVETRKTSNFETRNMHDGWNLKWMSKLKSKIETKIERCIFDF